MKKLTVLAVALVVAAFATSASAEEQGKLTVPETTIYGRPNRPNVTVEVARATMKLPLKDLTGPSSSAVNAAAKKEPF